MKQQFFIPAVFPGWNELIDSAKKDRYGKKAYQSLKHQYEGIIAKALMDHHVKPVSKASFSFVWLEPNKRRDKDNVCAGGRKIILDTLQSPLLRIIPNDNWECIIGGFKDTFLVNKNKPGVLVIMEGKI